MSAQSVLPATEVYDEGDLLYHDSILQHGAPVTFAMSVIDHGIISHIEVFAHVRRLSRAIGILDLLEVIPS